MLYHLIDWLESLGVHIPGMGLMNYLSFRALLAAVISMLIAFFAGKKIIAWLQRRQIGETIRDLGLEGQMQKKGTPTMGGVIIILSLLGSALLVCRLDNIYTLLLILTTVWCGGIGFADDYIKVFRHNKEGMSEKGKLLLQFGLGLVIALTVCISPDIPTERLVTTIPFVKAHEFDYSWLSPFSGQLGVYTSWGLYMIMIILVILACSNGTNLTDGMDGLSAGTSAIVGVVIGVMAWLGGDALDSRYLNIMYIPGSGEVAVFMAAFVGALIGFLWYNTFPAMVFMGDTGSLAIGGIIGVSAVLIRKELLLPILCGIFLVESLSVIIQRSWFKYTKRKYGEGRRVFLMAPLHHHYQKKGIPEPRIVARFWIIGIILAISTLALLKIR
ncbi:MAG TPA: phospho-N-acetylmuramoyl-pentapeptide-transferase [Candidatus Cryptobacteroides merdipullorum]|uniref:Phospho-N-acetylmuramoyl-pentapeptide-transferase n=1 Tax=Candidatus Cryptobacteroides merdipullorum TaxID=2840771 RepID=A0A9D1GNF6_9BACT|nr:phospho-N-acetylmuramoyl-pentapeptide-transferase [Candidatus Cryptobacteroides merdipullorum]